MQPQPKLSYNNTNYANPRRVGTQGFQMPEHDRYFSDLNPYYPLADPSDTTLVFESRFESGNLKRALKMSEFEYELHMRPDYNSQGYT